MNPHTLLDRLAHGQMSNVRFADASAWSRRWASSWTASAAAITSTGIQPSASGSPSKPAVARPSRTSFDSFSTSWSVMPSD